MTFMMTFMTMMLRMFPFMIILWPFSLLLLHFLTHFPVQILFQSILFNRRPLPTHPRPPRRLPLHLLCPSPIRPRRHAMQGGMGRLWPLQKRQGKLYFLLW